MMVIYWQGKHEHMYEYNKIPMRNAAPYMACDVSVQSKGLNADTHSHCKYRGLKSALY